MKATERTILSERHYAAGYVIRHELIDGKPYHGADFETKTAYTPDGEYIGPSKRAHFLCKKRGIKPELACPDHNVCAVGFCEAEQKWYGWSHRAMYGFGIGSSVKRGDCGYVPTDEKDFLKDCVRFWDEDDHLNTEGIETLDHDGQRGIQVSWNYSETVPNKKIRGKFKSIFTPYPDEFGRGEWTAENLDDAKQMAVDFASGVS